MERYDSYKDSGVESLGIVPESWKTSRFKYHHIELDDTVGEDSNSYPLLSLTKGGVIFRDVESGKGKFPESFENYKIVEKNNLIFCLYDIEETPRTVGISENNGMITGSYKIFKTKNSVIPKFTYYTYLVIDDVKGLKPYYTGLRNVVRPETFKNLPLNIPTIQEQQQIVEYLDEQTQLIDSLIKKTGRKIELLKEKRTSLINEVVTKGLNPNVEMKDSGVEWIGKIPSHWETIKLKYQGEVIIGLSYSPENVVDEGEESTLVMRSSNVQNGKTSFNDNVFVNCDIPDKLRTRESDILICSRNGSRRLIGKNCLIQKKHEGLTWGVFMTVYRSRSPKFFYWLLNSPVFESQSGLFLTSTINQLTVSTLENMVVPFVSDIHEQQQIVEYLDEQTQKIDKTISIEEKRIKLLKEYRSSLISEVVTGKRKVTTNE
ncbi:MAG: restriction endonuclease subunit S [Chitinophagales bacterium]